MLPRVSQTAPIQVFAPTFEYPTRPFIALFVLLNGVIEVDEGDTNIRKLLREAPSTDCGKAQVQKLLRKWTLLRKISSIGLDDKDFSLLILVHIFKATKYPIELSFERECRMGYRPSVWFFRSGTVRI